MTEPLSYSVQAAAEAIGVSKGLVWRLIREKKLRTFKLGSRTLISREDLVALLDARRAA